MRHRAPKESAVENRIEKISLWLARRLMFMKRWILILDVAVLIVVIGYLEIVEYYTGVESIKWGE